MKRPINFKERLNGTRFLVKSGGEFYTYGIQEIVNDTEDTTTFWVMPGEIAEGRRPYCLRLRVNWSLNYIETIRPRRGEGTVSTISHRSHITLGDILSADAFIQRVAGRLVKELITNKIY